MIEIKKNLLEDVGDDQAPQEKTPETPSEGVGESTGEEEKKEE